MCSVKAGEDCFCPIINIVVDIDIDIDEVSKLEHY